MASHTHRHTGGTTVGRLQSGLSWIGAPLLQDSVKTSPLPRPWRPWLLPKLSGPVKSQKGGSVPLTWTQCLSPSSLSEITGGGWGCLGGLADIPDLVRVRFNHLSLTVALAYRLTMSLGGGGVIHREDRGGGVITPPLPLAEVPRSSGGIHSLHFHHLVGGALG
jgi:hypothetical protein